MRANNYHLVDVDCLCGILLDVLGRRRATPRKRTLFCGPPTNRD
jgi:hypothetical protein